MFALPLRTTILRTATVGLVAALSFLPVPNGTRPTQLSGLSVVAVGANQMNVTGSYKTTTGQAIAGMQVKVYAAAAASFTLWSSGYTDNSGNFSIQSAKVPVGTKVQVEVEGNGAYSRPYPTFSRP